MADALWIENIKKIVFQAIEAADPCDVISGIVVKEKPVEIQISQKTTLNRDQILLPIHFTDHMEIMVLPNVGEVSVIIKNALNLGDNVLLIQKKGGQQYAVVGKL